MLPAPMSPSHWQSAMLKAGWVPRDFAILEQVTRIRYLLSYWISQCQVRYHNAGMIA